MLWKRTWEPEAVLTLLGGIVMAFFFGNLLAGVLHQTGVRGFRSDESVGNLLLATLSFHGTAIIGGTLFLWHQKSSWREMLGRPGWRHCFALACIILVVAVPLIIAAKLVSDAALMQLHQPIEDQHAVELLMGSKAWARCYLVFFAVVLAPVAEEFVFRGLLFSLAVRLGWRKTGWVAVSLLFALIHFNLPTFLPLFVLALALTWLCEVTEGLRAPIIAHSLFNGANVILLCVEEHAKLLGK